MNFKKSVSIVLQERWGVHQFIVMNKANYFIERMCKVLKVPRSCYYRCYTSNISKRGFENQRLIQVVKKVSEESRKTYGSLRITANLKRHSYVISRPRVVKLMRKEELISKIKKRFRGTRNSITDILFQKII